MKRIIYTLTFFLSLVIVSCGSTKDNVVNKTDTMSQDINEMPKPGPAPKISFKKPQVYKLDNGMTIIVVENHKLPRVSASLRMDNPPVALKDKKGSDDLLGSLLGSGSQTVSKDDFNKKVDFYGARVSLHEGGFRINSLSKYFSKVLALTVDQAIHPKFTIEEFDAEKSKLIEGLKMDEKSTPSAARRVTNKLAYGNHPYGESTTIKTAENINLADVQNYYKNNFIPNNAYLVVVGDVKADDIKNMAEKAFGDWQKANVSTPAIPEIVDVPATEIDFVNMPNAEQTELKVVQKSIIKKNNPDYQKVLLMNSILGGDFNSYLNMTLREKHGWTYGARSRFGTDKYGALFTASTSVRNTVADSAVVETLAQINKILNEKVDPETLKNTKAKYLGNFVLQMEKPSTIANQAYSKFVNNLPDDYFETFLEKVEAVTVDDVQAVAKKYLNPQQLRIVVAGKASITVPGLEKEGYKINYFDKDGNPTEKPKMNIKIPAGVTTATVLDAYFEAIGGKSKVKAVKSLLITSQASMQGRVIDFEKKAMAPNKSATLVSMMGMELSKEVFDGTKGYIKAQGQTKEFTAEEIAKKQQESQPFGTFGLYKNGKLDRIENIDGKNYYVIVDNDQTEYYFDQKTGLKIKEVATVEMQGKTMTQIVSFEDYKDFSGIKFPSKTIVPMGPMKIEVITKEVKFNTLTPADFK